MAESFDGRATIRVRFRSRIQYEKFRKYILKTQWTYDLDYPEWEELTLDFHKTEDVEEIVKHIVGLLQYGFEVYCCRFQMESHLAEDEHPAEEDPPEEELEEFDISKMVSNMWKEAEGKLNIPRSQLKHFL